MQLPSTICSTSPGYSTSSDIHRQQYSTSSNPVVRHCVQQGAISSSSQQLQRYDSNFSRADSVNVSKPKNPIFQYCVEKMQGEAPNAYSPSHMCEAFREQDTTQVSDADRNTNEIPPPMPTDLRFRTGGFSMTEMENKLKLAVNDKPAVATLSNVCGQPTSPTSKSVNAPHLAGAGRARLHAEARKNNFGGICFSTAARAAGKCLFCFVVNDNHFTPFI